MLGVVVMTALPPTEGHLSLIRFAGSYMRQLGGQLRVLVCVLPDEPPGRAEHRDALWEALRGEEARSVQMEVQFSNDPQGPTGPDDDAFWTHWVRTVLRQTANRGPTHVFSSEAYGPRLATALDAEHVPFDAARSCTRVTGTMVRKSLVTNFEAVVKPLRDRLRRRIVIFGQESTGKTTLTKNLARVTGSIWTPEWARPYLEALPSPEITQDRMMTIVRGQAASEAAAVALTADRGCPFLFQDTDLVSTLGYQLHWCRSRVPERYRESMRPGYLQSGIYRTDYNRAERDLNEVWAEIQNSYVPADLYIVLSDEAEFVPDPLRYGGDRRETTRQYWVDLLRERDLPYYEMKSHLGQDGFVAEALEASHECLANRAGFVGYERKR